MKTETSFEVNVNLYTYIYFNQILQHTYKPTY